MSPFIVSRNPNNPNFLMDRTAINDEILSFNSRGLLAYLFSKPHGYKFSYDDILSNSPDSIEVIIEAVNELLLYGYLVSS